MCGVGSTSIFLLLLHVLLVRIIIRGNRVLVVGSLGRHYRCRHIVSGWIDWHSMLCAGFLMVTTVHSKNLSWSPYFPDKLDGVNLYVLYRLQIRIHYIEVAEKQNRTFAVNSRTNHHHNHHLPMNCCNQIVNSKNLSWSPYFPNKSDGVNLYVLYRLQIRIHYIEVAEKKNCTSAVNSHTNHHHNHHLPMNCCNQIVMTKRTQQWTTTSHENECRMKKENKEEEVSRKGYFQNFEMLLGAQSNSHDVWPWNSSMENTIEGVMLVYLRCQWRALIVGNVF